MLVDSDLSSWRRMLVDSDLFLRRTRRRVMHPDLSLLRMVVDLSWSPQLPHLLFQRTLVEPGWSPQRPHLLLQRMLVEPGWYPQMLWLYTLYPVDLERL